jgi:pimeloyl-ACP methyl ester carboxylesterase
MTAHTGFAPVNGLEMYYEIHGSGEPLLLLPGAYMTVELMGDLVPALARTHQVIGVEFQAHGHTVDIDRAFSYEQFADDAATVLEHLGVERADVYGYSLGGGVALQVGLRHPNRVRKLVIASASSSSDGMYPQVLGGIENITPEMFDGTPWRDAYDRTAPNPSAFPALVEKLKQLDLTPFDWEIDSLAAPALILVGDSDGTRLDHAVEMFQRLGGGVFGDLAPELPASQLAILPGTTHVGMLERGDWIAGMVTAFLATGTRAPS